MLEEPSLAISVSANIPAIQSQPYYAVEMSAAMEANNPSINKSDLDASNAIMVGKASVEPTTTAKLIRLTLAKTSSAGDPDYRDRLTGPTIREQIGSDTPTTTSRIPVTLSASSSSAVPSVMSNVERHTELRPEIVAGTPLVVKAVSRPAHFGGTPNLDLDVVDATGENLIKDRKPKY